MLHLLDGANDALPRPFRGPMRFGLMPATAAFSPASLFTAGEQGVWYDPSDLTTLYQDHFGAIPAAYGQPVGLMLDKSKGGPGPELVANHNFDTDTGWTKFGTVTWANGAYRIADVGGSDSSIRQQILGTVAGRTYRVAIRLLENNTGTSGLRARVGTQGSASLYGDIFPPTAFTGLWEFIFKAPADDVWLTLLTSTTDTYAIVDRISIREIPGNHASQPTVTARPTLMQDAGGRAYLQFDGVDDLMETAVIAGFGAPFYAAAALRAVTLNGASTRIGFFGSSFGLTDRAELAARLSGDGAVGQASTMVRVAGGTLSEALSASFLNDRAPHVVSGGFQLDALSVRSDGVLAATSPRTNTHGTFPGALRVGQNANAAINFYGGVYRFGNDMTEARMKQAEDFLKQKSGMVV